MVDHLKVVDAATLEGNGRTLHLFGIVAQSGDGGIGLQNFLAGAGNRVFCQTQPDQSCVCVLADGTDLAMAALANGAAEAGATAPDAYRQQQEQARSAHRGLWAARPPPPITLAHPTVVDTATLMADGHTYRLQGIEGLRGHYADDLGRYIAANGDNLACQLQGNSGRYTCLLPNGMDLAKAALVNGAARVANDAPDSYRIQQGEALQHRRGIWAR